MPQQADAAADGYVCSELLAHRCLSDARFSYDLMLNIFIPGTPLHDGAVVLRGDTVVAASCFLPLTTRHRLSSELGTRHRAAIGLTEETDALVIVVSEETGTISLAVEEQLPP